MIAADRERIELALEKEHRTSQRQALLKQLWRLTQRGSGVEHHGPDEGAAKDPNNDGEGDAPTDPSM
jgi:hypothetical protein